MQKQQNVAAAAMCNISNMQQYQQAARHCRAMSPYSGSNMQQHQAAQIGNSSDRQQHQHCTISNATSQQQLQQWQYTTQAKCSSMQQDQQAARYCTVMPTRICMCDSKLQHPAAAAAAAAAAANLCQPGTEHSLQTSWGPLL